MTLLRRGVQSHYRRRVARLLGCNNHEVAFQAVYLPGLRMIYFRNPKVANSTILTTLWQAEQAAAGLSACPETRSKPSAASSLENDLPGFLRALRSQEFFRFSFVRNPYARLVSCYLEKIVGSIPKPHKRSELKLRSQGLVTLVEFLEAIERQRPLEMNRHWRPQAIQIPSNIALDFVGRLEKFSQDFAIVLARLGIPEFPVQVVRRHPTAAEIKLADLIGPQEKQLIDCIYAMDFARFGYPMELPISSIEAKPGDHALATNRPKNS